jgi:hypothetical protein
VSFRSTVARRARSRRRRHRLLGARWRPGLLLRQQWGPFVNGIVQIGEFDGGMEAVERQPENSSVTIERAE